MEVFLPIAHMPMPILSVLGMGGAVGLLSGLFGVGGGFLLTPLLMMAGVPPAVATASDTNQIVRLGRMLRGEQLRVVFSVIVLAVALKILYNLLAMPSSMIVLGGGH